MRLQIMEHPASLRQQAAVAALIELLRGLNGELSGALGVDSPSWPLRRAGAGAVDRPRLLDVFAHPDDETFLAGGTLATYGAAGWDVRVACATRGEAGRRGPYEGASTADFGELRMSELRAAGDALGEAEWAASAR